MGMKAIAMANMTVPPIIVDCVRADEVVIDARGIEIKLDAEQASYLAKRLTSAAKAAHEMVVEDA